MKWAYAKPTEGERGEEESHRGGLDLNKLWTNLKPILNLLMTYRVQSEPIY